MKKMRNHTVCEQIKIVSSKPKTFKTKITNKWSHGVGKSWNIPRPMQKHCHYWTGVTFLLHTRKRISWLWNIQYGRQTCMSAPGKWNWRKFSLRRKTNLCISQLLIRLQSSWCQESIGYCNPATTFLVSFAVLLLLLLWLLWGEGGSPGYLPPPPTKCKSPC